MKRSAANTKITKTTMMRKNGWSNFRCINQVKTSVDLTSATEDDIFNEYAREMCGEFNRWALLKRHKAFETRLPKYNTRAAQSFKAFNYYRPISQDFLSQISNKEAYGDNGYGTTASSGLK